jgi:hypothetical protein
MADQQNNQIRDQYEGQSQQDNQEQQASDETPNNNQEVPGDFGNQGNEVGYSYLGPHGLDNEDAFTAPDGYGPQDQFGDLDDQDPYSNLYDEDPGSSLGGEALSDPEEELYGLAEPLAKAGDESRKGSDKDRYGTRMSQDQTAYQ